MTDQADSREPNVDHATAANPFGLPADIELRAAAALSATPRSFLRWAGSKQRLLPQLVPYLPSSFNTYFEPFLGAGALFFLLQPPNARLGDMCAPLVETYRSVASHHLAIHDLLSTMDILDRDEYYRIRAAHPTNAVKAAARFIFLNRGAWNGLYRVNTRGEFNVPYGRPRSPNIIDLQNLRACANLLSRPTVSVSVSDFETLASEAKSGDFVYFDPPYVTGHNNNGFIDYNQKLFSWSDQVRLAALAERLRKRGVHVMVSNAEHEAIIALYPNFRVGSVTRRSTLASSIAARKQITEAVFY